MKYIIFLQNAWSPAYAGRPWPRRSWLNALALSRSGVRLGVLFDAGTGEGHGLSDFDRCHNTTPITGGTASSIVPPDFRHMHEIIDTACPDCIVACGKQAHDALEKIWCGPLITVPHPAHRLLTDELYVGAGGMLRADCVPDGKRIKIIQLAKGNRVECIGYAPALRAAWLQPIPTASEAPKCRRELLRRDGIE